MIKRRFSAEKVSIHLVRQGITRRIIHLAIVEAIKTALRDVAKVNPSVDEILLFAIVGQARQHHHALIAGQKDVVYF